jgi:hypothetical protein
MNCLFIDGCGDGCGVQLLQESGSALYPHVCCRRHVAVPPATMLSLNHLLEYQGPQQPPSFTNGNNGNTSSSMDPREDGHVPKKCRDKTMARHTELKSRP